MKRIIFLLLGACLCACGRYGCGVPAGYEPLLDAALAGCPRADSLRNLLRQTPREQREGMAFLIAHMPRGDRDTMRLDLLREADAIVREEMEAAGVGAWQYFAVVPDMRATGVRDGVRAYEWPAIIRAINTVDVMTAEVPELDWALLKRMTDRITHEVPGICRVCYDLTPKPVGTVEHE